MKKTVLAAVILLAIVIFETIGCSQNKPSSDGITFVQEEPSITENITLQKIKHIEPLTENDKSLRILEKGTAIILIANKNYTARYFISADSTDDAKGRLYFLNLVGHNYYLSIFDYFNDGLAYEIYIGNSDGFLKDTLHISLCAYRNINEKSSQKRKNIGYTKIMENHCPVFVTDDGSLLFDEKTTNQLLTTGDSIIKQLR